MIVCNGVPHACICDQCEEILRQQRFAIAQLLVESHNARLPLETATAMKKRKTESDFAQEKTCDPEAVLGHRQLDNSHHGEATECNHVTERPH